jgi:ABC-type multidrug transport system ATPase subunit
VDNLCKNCLIHIQNLTKRYEKLIAVDNLSLDIGQSEVFGLLGPNGAGKTTVIHMLATLLKPTSGSATVNGFDILKDPEKELAQNFGNKKNLPYQFLRVSRYGYTETYLLKE